VGFEPTTLAFELAKAVHASDPAAAMIGGTLHQGEIIIIVVWKRMAVP
jgi:hypothetical protein